LFFVALLLVGYPLFELIRSALAGPSGPSGAWHTISTRPVAMALLHTVEVSAAATILATLLGVAMALLVARSDLPFRRWFAGAWVAPLIIPAYVTGLAWLDAYTQAGLTDQVAHLSAGWIIGPVGVALLLGLQGAPLAYLLILSALSSGRIGELEDAARISGRTPARVLWEITLPLVKTAIFGSMLLVFVSSASDFGIPAILAIPASYSTVTTLIYSDLSFAGGTHAIASASSLSAVLGLLAIVLLFTSNRVSRTNSGSTRSNGLASSARPLIAFGRFRNLVVTGCLLILVLTTVIPLMALYITSVSPAFRLELAPSHWVASAYAQALSGANIAALGRSALIAAAAATIVATGGALVALWNRRPSRLATLTSTLLSLPFALPGSVVAIAILLAWERWLYGSLFIILIAYVARFAVIGVRTAAVTMGGLSDDLVHAARASGASARRASRDVIWPVLIPGIVTSFAIVFLLGIHELTMSSLLYGPSTQTFAVAVLASEEAGQTALTASLAMVVTVITTVVAGVALFARSSRKIVAAEAGIEVPSWQK